MPQLLPCPACPPPPAPVLPTPCLPAAVRKRCLAVLSHLILGDVMKVKGHIANIAVCLRSEEDEEVSQIARAFFCTLVSP